MLRISCSPPAREKEAHKALRAQQENALPLCAWWLKQKATDQCVLRLNLALLWTPIDALPDAADELRAELATLKAQAVSPRPKAASPIAPSLGKT